MKITKLAPNFGRVLASIIQTLWNQISQNWNAETTTWDKW
jgi:hypothetical protein